MTEKPILFSGAMVRAILDGRKTQTRRMVKPQPPIGGLIHYFDERFILEKWPRCEREMGNFGRCEDIFCPHGQPGDRLWVKETFAPSPEHPRCRVAYQADLTSYGLDNGIARKTEDSMGCVYPSPITNPKKPWGDSKGGWKPSIFMPRWASRITLEITGVRVERLNEISPKDARAEGIEKLLRPNFNDYWWKNYGKPVFANHTDKWDQNRELHYLDPIPSYKSLWESINGSGSWEKNSWCWVIEFKRVTPCQTSPC